MRKPLTSRFMIAGFTLLLAAIVATVVIHNARADAHSTPSEQPGSPIHPVFALLDEDGENVLDTNQPISTMQTCGQCHDTAYIESHSFHADLGLNGYAAAGQAASGTPWDASDGPFGKWNPLTYRYLSQDGDERLDLSTAEWIMVIGDQHTGGGPATINREGIPLADLRTEKVNPETNSLDPRTGQPKTWNWDTSGTIEMNCFLCHIADPNNASRIEAIEAGHFGEANTRTLLGTGILLDTGVAGGPSQLAYNPEAFDENGELKNEYIFIQAPTNENCAQCHGLVHADDEPLTLTGCSTDYILTATTGQIISPDKINESGMNISGKNELSQAWDIHAERQLECTDCHFSLNNPAQVITPDDSPEHLVYDPRKLDLGDYLLQPNHQFARGESAQYTIAPELKGSMRRCESCHDASVHADWLPYLDRHMEILACESCHIPQVYAPAIQQYDWTVLKAGDEPATICRGVEGQDAAITNLVTGYEPILLQRQNVDGDTLLAPYNLITAWFWVYDDANGSTRPVRLYDLNAAWFEGGEYAAEIMAAFDANQDGNLQDAELVIDNDAKQSAVSERLIQLGLNNPRILGQVQPYSLNHGVSQGEWSVNDCRACHSNESRISQPLKLADYIPAGVMPEFVQDANIHSTGEMVVGDDGALYYQPQPQEDKLYIFGHSRYGWVDWLGGLFFLGVLAGVAGHGGLRAWRSRKNHRNKSEVRRVLMYQAYERFWHWLQTALIVILLLTGLIIHRPDLFGIFSFRGMVTIHNISAAILAVNAALSLFYHLTTGQLRQYLPRPRGFFDDAIEQSKYYLRGIFKHEPHPFEKTPEKKLNPLQQVTYLGILNVLLPLQGLTGILMWGVQNWPQYAKYLGGLPGLAALHSLLAWLFAAFIIGHIYLTTTSGPQPLAAIQAMVTGWEDVEVHDYPHPSPKTGRGKKRRIND